ncbi:unnamed protein product [Clonostachys rosea]|uniref:DUF2415 domain-containing protein n=1 Tax=Bionectria ochroleuca TaxID=29856 RepID=A0ABY6TZK1_BIOOC|nr:unnamed protein product [Clonostachys rosea]
MAVKDDSLHFPTETIVSKKPRKHFRVPVRSQHWQLRSLISAEKQHIVYLPGGHGSNHVQRLNTKTRECETIKLLTFAPRCLVAKGGWLCCGSEQGDFVAIRLNEDAICETTNRTTSGQDASESSLDLDYTLNTVPFGAGGTESGPSDALLGLIARARRGNKSLIAKNIRLAKERVNCITLWFPPTQHAVLHGNAYTFPVAVLANNDKTVALVHLNEREDPDKLEAMDVITYPDYVNRAIISPDGRLLIAILDDPYLYIHERVEQSPQPDTLRARIEKVYNWELKQTILLKSQKAGDISESRGSFAASFSMSGAYLAIGTQHGTISIFDAERLTDTEVDPLITTFTSSRPKSGSGAIRDMAFCPGPYDILAWTEDRGHIGLADVRSNFAIRQIVDISSQADFEHFEVLDRNTVDPRLLDRRAERNIEGAALDEPSLVETRRRTIDGLNHPLTANETLVLEAIQEDRRRRERLNARTRDNMSPRTVSGGFFRSESGSLFRSGRVPIFPTEGESSQEPERDSNTSRAIGDLLGNYRDQRDRAHERARSARQLLRDASERPSMGPRRTDHRWIDRLGEQMAAMRDQRDRQDSSYLNVLEILQAREPYDGDPDLLVPLVNQVVTRWEESAVRGTLVQDTGFFDYPPSDDNTAGLAWSEDGRTLFVGAQNGIYEFKINTLGRKFSPSIQFR